MPQELSSEALNESIKTVLTNYLGHPFTRETKNIVIKDVNKFLKDMRRKGLVDTCEVVNLELEEEGVFRLALIQDRTFKTATIEFYRKPKKEGPITKLHRILNFET